MMRGALIALFTTALLAGPLSAAGAPSEDEADVPVLDEMSLPHPVTLPGSYVALPPELVTQIRNKILVSLGQEPEEDGSHDDKGGH